MRFALPNAATGHHSLHTGQQVILLLGSDGQITQSELGMPVHLHVTLCDSIRCT